MTRSVVANPNVTPGRYPRQTFRFLEILPGAAVWLTLLAPFALSYTFPLFITTSIIVFDVFWLQKSLQTAYSLLRGWFVLRANLRRDWKQQLDMSLAARRGADDTQIIDWRDVYQAVIFPTYKEEEAILEASIGSVAEADYPVERKILVLATEARDAENARRVAAHLKEKFADRFALFLVTEHPDGIVGEVKGKGANATWAAKELVAEMSRRSIDLDRVIVTTADADTRFYKQYLQCLTYMYATTPDRTRCSYQPVATFTNNIWEASMVARVLALQTTFWQMVESTRDWRLITFSTHAMSLKTLDDMDYWCTTVVNEDSRQFYRAYFRYGGNFRAIPLFLPVYMDAVHLGSFHDTMKKPLPPTAALGVRRRTYALRRAGGFAPPRDTRAVANFARLEAGQRTLFLGYSGFFHHGRRLAAGFAQPHLRPAGRRLQFSLCDESPSDDHLGRHPLLQFRFFPNAAAAACPTE